MIELRRLNFKYNRKSSVLKNVNLRFEAGKIYGLLGKNGAGKSTIIKNITGMLFPTEGSCTVFSREARKRSVKFLSDLFFVPEDYYLPNISIEKLLAIYMDFYPNFCLEQFKNYLKEFQIGLSRKTSDLSLGQKKKVLIGFALSANTKVLIMDEPSNGLDIPSKITFRKMIKSSFNENRIVIISSHQVRDLDELIDDIIIVDNGEVILNISKEEVAKNLTFYISENKDPSNQILYQEKVSTGYGIIRLNKSQEAAYVDIELLFNAILSNREIKNHL